MGRIFAGVLVLGAVAAAPAHASDRLYVSHGDEIRAIDPSGAGPLTTLYSGQTDVAGIDFDSTRNRLVWSARADRSIRVAPLDGSGPVEELTGTGDYPGALAVDRAGDRVLWFPPVGLNATPLGGGSTTPVYPCCDNDPSVRGPENGGAIAVDDVNGRIYFAGGMGGSTIRSAPLDGSGPVDTLYGFESDSWVSGLALDPAHGYLYWAYSNSGGGFSPMVSKIQRGPIDGSGPIEDIYPGNLNAAGIAVDVAEGYLFWSTTFTGEIRRAPLNGGGPVQTIATGGEGNIVLVRTPFSTAAPVVSGGSTLTCGKGAWAPDVPGSFVHRPAATYTYRWQRDGADIGGADRSTYTPTQSGEYRCIVTAKNAAGTTAAASAAHTVTVSPPAPPPDADPVQTLALGAAYLGRSGSIFVPITCANRATDHCDTTLTIRFKKPNHGFKTITRKLRLAEGSSLTRISLSRKQRRKILRIRRLRVTATLTTPAGDRVSREGTLVGRVSLRG